MEIIERLDSLWFFSNMFSSGSVIPDSGAASSTPIEDPAIEETKPSPIVQNEAKQSESEAGISIPKAPNSVEIPMFFETEALDVAEYYSSSPREKEQRKRRPRSKRGLHRNRRKILGELDLGFHLKATEVSGSNWHLFEENWGYSNQKLMPSLNLSDNMAMKEHLKTWAYAVACTVR